MPDAAKVIAVRTRASAPVASAVVAVRKAAMVADVAAAPVDPTDRSKPDLMLNGGRKLSPFFLRATPLTATNVIDA